MLPKEISIAKNKTRLNGAIRASELRVIDEDGSQLGVLSKSDALRRADEAGLDLVEVSPNANPPVARIVDWGKYNYQKTKQAQKNKKKQKAAELKQIRFGLKIGEHDLDIKLKKVREFLEDGHKVKISAFFKGREMAHKEIGYELLDKVVKKIEDIAVVETEPQMAGRHLSILVRRGSGAKTKDA
ncbi:MAG: translation initiation factor IF-3 [Candidatus Saccharimonadales bacterium]|nr:translation initiation factor IF-3 [Candidatus Saccharimonadales bacterium]